VQIVAAWLLLLSSVFGCAITLRNHIRPSKGRGRDRRNEGDLEARELGEWDACTAVCPSWGSITGMDSSQVASRREGADGFERGAARPTCPSRPGQLILKVLHLAERSLIPSIHRLDITRNSCPLPARRAASRATRYCLSASSCASSSSSMRRSISSVRSWVSMVCNISLAADSVAPPSSRRPLSFAAELQKSATILVETASTAMPYPGRRRDLCPRARSTKRPGNPARWSGTCRPGTARGKFPRSRKKRDGFRHG
jgi:hypothetical protein